MYYTQTRPFSLHHLYLHDAPMHETNQKALERYVADASTVLTAKIASVGDFTKPFTAEDEKRLCAMMALVIDARKAWEEESHSIYLRQQAGS